jgi:hypothetical protein
MMPLSERKDIVKSLVYSAFFLALVVCLLSSGPAFAQTATTGTITGTVVDSTGAVAAKATITIKNLDKGSKMVTKTNAKGDFVFPFVAPGRYSVQVDATGAPQYVTSTNVTVGVETTVRVTLGEFKAKQ